MPKLTKLQAGYQETKLDPAFAKYGHSCETCSLFDSEKRQCSVVRGKIQPEHTCNLWTNDNTIDATWISGKDGSQKIKNGGMSRTEAGYVNAIERKLRPPQVDEEKVILCGNCGYFDVKTKSCEPVRGRISEWGCCNYFLPPGVDAPKYKDFMSGPQVQHALKDIEDLYF